MRRCEIGWRACEEGYLASICLRCFHSLSSQNKPGWDFRPARSCLLERRPNKDYGIASAYGKVLWRGHCARYRKRVWR